jgi:hypothetical protein
VLKGLRERYRRFKRGRGNYYYTIFSYCICYWHGLLGCVKHLRYKYDYQSYISSSKNTNILFTPQIKVCPKHPIPIRDIFLIENGGD